jgi:3-oxoacyl-(acyl-carrier-protein) synthase
MPSPSAQPGHAGQSPTNAPRAAIAGLGLISPLGRSLWATSRALLEGRTTTDILDKAQREIDADPDPGTHPAVALTLDAALLTRTVGSVGRVAPWMEDPAVELADLAAREAFFDATGASDPEHFRGVRTIVASSKGAVLTLLDEQWKKSRDGAAVLGPHGWLAHRLRRRLGLGHTTSVVAACATSACALHQARREIESGEHDRVLVVAVEAALHPILAHSYKRLGVLAPIDPLRAHRPRPLDKRRAGFTLVEIASAALLERDDLPGDRRRGVLLGSALGTEPYDIVRSAPVFGALASCVARAVPRGTSLQLIQPHATGTVDNDVRELAAISTALPGSLATPIYASKGALGHPLGASALVNLAIGCAFARFGRRAPMPWLDDPIECAFALSRGAQGVAPGAQVLTSAGFGGHVGAVCFEAFGPRCQPSVSTA